jgi:hypothetical protein
MAELAGDLSALALDVATFTTLPRGFEQPIQFSRLQLREA